MKYFYNVSMYLFNETFDATFLTQFSAKIYFPLKFFFVKLSDLSEM